MSGFRYQVVMGTPDQVAYQLTRLLPYTISTPEGVPIMTPPELMGGLLVTFVLTSEDLPHHLRISYDEPGTRPS